MSKTMIERMSWAYALSFYSEERIAQFEPNFVARFYEQASRNVLAAMREPSDAMLEAMYGSPERWKRGIDAALKDE